MDLGTAAVTGITVICYLVGLTAKAAGLDGRWIPTAVGLSGAVLGVAGLYTMAEFPAGDVISALAVGILSGLASTGADQLVKKARETLCGD